MMKSITTVLAGVAALTLGALPALAQDHKLRIQTHFGAESVPGELIQKFINHVETMSGGSVEIQMHYSSEVVAQNEVMSAASQGILDCDMGGITGNVGKDAGWQLAGDIMGGYDTPYQFLTWFYHEGGREVVQEHLYDPQDMHVIGFWLQGHESLSSTSPLAGFADLKDWKFRSPPGLETEIFSSFGAKPVVMDFGEVPNALRTGIVDGADASTLNTNVRLGLFDVASHATFPGFHSMPAEQLSCNKKAWAALPASAQTAIELALKGIALDLALLTAVRDGEASVALTEQGVTLHDWSVEDRKAFRDFAQGRWADWGAKSPAAQAVLDSHLAYMSKIGLVN
ncbi:MAG: TRAP transporter substrate-binding protein DctP [Paracoccaceae bacterium]|nr:TRAP transporter substrate-binding protein DctP [Paracoccaceae bacterium]MDE2914646.1 TRAP transporter substrate-binding protein DctP [Paracoccaceae bacterium]